MLTDEWYENSLWKLLSDSSIIFSSELLWEFLQLKEGIHRCMWGNSARFLGVNPRRADALLLETPTGRWAQSRVQGFHCQIYENELAAHPVPGLLLAVSLSSWPCTMRDLSSPTRDRTHAPCAGRVLTTGPPGKFLGVSSWLALVFRLFPHSSNLQTCFHHPVIAEHPWLRPGDTGSCTSSS